MKNRIVKINGISLGKGNPLVLIAGPCVIESDRSVIREASELKKITSDIGMPLIFKASFDKANRSSVRSFRGPGIKRGLKVLREIKEDLGIPVLSDIHSVEQVKPAAKVLDVIQIPAFLCRQTDLLVEAGGTGKAINVKKGQFMSPEEMKNVIDKIEYSGNNNILLTERGTMLGYNMLVNDFRGVAKMSEFGYPVVYDATHSVQMPGGKGSSSGGEAGYVLPLSKAATAIGCDALFLEVHPSPEKAKSDGSNMLKLSEVPDFLRQIRKIEEVVRAV